MLVLAVAPVWFISALLSLPLRPFHQFTGHLVLLALLGWIFVELTLIGDSTKSHSRVPVCQEK